jgi:hypothetical protein
LILVINPVIQYTTFERLVGGLLAYRAVRKGVTSTGSRPGGVGRSSLSDWDMFVLGAVSKLVATGGTYPYVSERYPGEMCAGKLRGEGTLLIIRRSWSSRVW